MEKMQILLISLVIGVIAAMAIIEHHTVMQTFIRQLEEIIASLKKLQDKK